MPTVENSLRDYCLPFLSNRHHHLMSKKNQVYTWGVQWPPPRNKAGPLRAEAGQPAGHFKSPSRICFPKQLPPVGQNSQHPEIRRWFKVYTVLNCLIHEHPDLGGGGSRLGGSGNTKAQAASLRPEGKGRRLAGSTGLGPGPAFPCHR